MNSYMTCKILKMLRGKMFAGMVFGAAIRKGLFGWNADILDDAMLVKY